jgi:hypothetical protein
MSIRAKAYLPEVTNQIELDRQGDPVSYLVQLPAGKRVGIKKQASKCVVPKSGIGLLSKRSLPTQSDHKFQSLSLNSAKTCS